MNVLIATDSNIEKSGVCLFIYNWIKEARKIRQIEKITVYFRKSIIDHSLLEAFNLLNANIVVGGLPQNGTSLQPSNRKKVKKDIEKIMREEKYDVVHINSSAIGYTFLVLLESYNNRIPIRISHSHGRILNNGFKNVYLWFIKAMNKMLSTKYAGCSIDAGEYLFGSNVIKSEKWNFVANTIEAEKYRFSDSNRRTIRKELFINETDFILGTVGTINKRKNHIFLIEIISELKKNNIDAKLVIVGNGELKPKLIKRAKDLSIEESIIFYGETDEVYKVLSCFDVFLLPSLTEGLPISAVEAQANGLPCILSDQIPSDVKLLDDLSFLPIDHGVRLWTEKIKEIVNGDRIKREICSDIVKNKGFDNSSLSDYICSLYEIANIGK